MSAICDLRMRCDLSQAQFARLLGVPLETYRPWDSGRRLVPPEILERASRAADEQLRNAEVMTLDALATELEVHPRTLRAAARNGLFDVQQSIKSVFGRPMWLATRGAGRAFKRVHYRQRYGRNRAPVIPCAIVRVPKNYYSRLIGLRLRLKLTQHQLAKAIGAANKAVIYQWETQKRVPSPVFWQRVEKLQRTGVATPVAPRVESCQQ